jgi:serine protease inhibitor
MNQWNNLNSDNPPDSTYITSQREASRTWGTNNADNYEPPAMLDLPKPEQAMNRIDVNNDYLRIHNPTLPQPSDMICPHDNLSQFVEHEHEHDHEHDQPQHDQYNNQLIQLKPRQESLFSILSNVMYDKILPNLNNKYDHVFSPYSFYYILLCLLVGSNNTTFTELAKAMGMIRSEILPALTIESIKLHKELIDSQGIKIQILNGFFIDNRFKQYVIPRYIEFIKKVGKIHPVNFSNQRSTISTINGWVKDATRGMIPQMIDGSNIHETTKMIMINVIYYKADWEDKFDKASTEIQPFSQATGLKVKIPLMYQKSKQLFFQDSRYRLLTLSYHNPNFVMDFILPAQNNNDFPIRNLHQFLETYGVHQMEQEIKIYIPRFKQQTRQSYNSVLQKLNVHSMFNAHQAELYNIAKYSNDMDRIYVSNIIQEAVIVIDETGTEASAATAVVIDEYSIPLEKTSIVFRADRTFQYCLRYLPTNTILFTGLYDGN